MCFIPFAFWISNAAARFSGVRGAVSIQARRVGCSRQAIYDQARKVCDAVEDQYSGGPTREQLIRENQALREENAQLWEWVDQAVEFTVAIQQQFCAVAWAMGLSLLQIHVLMAVLQKPFPTASRSTIGRWCQAAGLAAGRILKQLDARCKALVLVGCLDEIFFHGRAVLVGVEPASMVWFLGKKVGKLRGSIWAEQLRAWDGLQHVIADAGRPLQAGIAQAQEERRQHGQEPLASTLDVFHTKHEAQQALAIDWNQVERDWEAFDKAEDQLQRTRRGGIPWRLRPARPVAPGPRWSRASITTRRSRRLGSMPKRRWRCSGPTANSTIEPGPRPRSQTPCRRGRSGLGAGRQPLAHPGKLHLLGSIARCVGVDPGSPGTA